MESTASFIEGETPDEREDRLLRVAASTPLVNQWCDCDEEQEFRCYPSNGECRCGMYKHHVHGACGHIIQVG